MNKNIEKNLEALILELATSISDEAKTRNNELMQQLNAQFTSNESLYKSEIQLAYLHFVQFAAIPWFSKYKVKDIKNKEIINYIYNGLLPHFIRKVIIKNEGSPCSGDKESFIVKQIQKAIITGENQSLYVTYEGCKTIDKSKWHERAYWSPESFEDTDEVIEKFWKWYNLDN